MRPLIAPFSRAWLCMVLTLLLVLSACSGSDPGLAPDRAEVQVAIGDKPPANEANDAPETILANMGIRGQSLPGNWRPFADDSPWNQTIPADAAVHENSAAIVSTLVDGASHLAYARKYTIPLWVVDSSLMTPLFVKSDKIFDPWDVDRNGWSDIGVPVVPEMWAEPTSDGHISIIDLEDNVVYEMSRFEWLPDGTPTCTTFNLWKLGGRGYGIADPSQRWQLQGARASGFPAIAGLVRPEEIEAGEIRHALVFTFSQNRRADDGSDIFMSPPACRSDGKRLGAEFPIQGMRFQLDPTLTEADFDDWGLTPETKIVARALQQYGMYLCDNGGDMKLMLQLLSERPSQHRRLWDRRFPGFYRSIENIPTDRFRAIDTGEPTLMN